MWQTLRINEIENKLNTNLKDGLSKDEVEKRRKEYGENKLEGKKKESIFVRFIKQFNDFMIILLIIASHTSIKL